MIIVSWDKGTNRVRVITPADAMPLELVDEFGASGAVVGVSVEPGDRLDYTKYVNLQLSKSPGDQTHDISLIIEMICRHHGWNRSSVTFQGWTDTTDLATSARQNLPIPLIVGQLYLVPPDHMLEEPSGEQRLIRVVPLPPPD